MFELDTEPDQAMDMDPFDFWTKGHQLFQPQVCPDQIYQIMTKYIL